MKKCCKCNNIQGLINFGKRNRNKDNLDDTCKTCRKLYYINNRNIILNKERIYRANNLNKISSYMRNRRKSDPIFKFKDNISSCIRSSFNRLNLKKTKRVEYILGCTVSEFKSYISTMFKDGMTIENHGLWEFDHIIPISSATTIDEVVELNKYTNFQPLWMSENRSKSNNF